MATPDAEVHKENLQPETTTMATEDELHSTLKRKAEDIDVKDAAAADPPAAEGDNHDIAAATTTDEDAQAAEGDDSNETAEGLSMQEGDDGDGTVPTPAADAGSPTAPTAEAAAAILSRPVKRARTAYFLFAEDRRAEVQAQLLPEIRAQHPGQGVAVVAKALGALWAGLSDDEKKVYQDKAAEEKDRLAAELLAWQAAGGQLVEEEVLPGAEPTNGGLVFPIARIRKICKLDPDVRGLSKEGLALVTKAAELFLAKLGTETVRVASIQNRRKLQAGDVTQVCATRQQFLFLREDMADLARLQQREAQDRSAAAKADDGGNRGSAAAKPAPFAAKPLTAFFDVRPK